MSFLTELLGVDKELENQNRRIHLLGEELDSLRSFVENALADKLQVGDDEDGGPTSAQVEEVEEPIRYQSE